MTKETADTDLGRGEAAGAPEADIARPPDAATEGGGQPGPRHHGLAQGASWEESIVYHISYHQLIGFNNTTQLIGFNNTTLSVQGWPLKTGSGQPTGLGLGEGRGSRGLGVR